MALSYKKLRSLRGRGLAELRVRCAQFLSASAERRGWSEQSRLPDDASFLRLLAPAPSGRGPRRVEDLLEHFRARRAPAFFDAFADRDETRAEFRRRFGPRAESAIVERARRAAEGRFDLLGLRDLSFGEPIDWHLEPLSGKKTPLVHWSRIDYLDAGVAGDKKVVWELNRHQHFMTLGRAYFLTGDELLARAFAAHLSDWMDHNPPKLGINWASSLEGAFRSISWLWALHFFQDSPHLRPALFARALKFLYLHARHLETYLSTYFSPNTHLTGEALGLFYLGTLLPEFVRAPRWRETGRRILLAQLGRHVRPDGVYFEQASYYQRYTADFYTHLLVLGRANGDAGLAGALAGRLTALLDHLMYITMPDGTTPLVGDDDGGRLAVLDERAPADFRAVLSTGAALFARPDYKFVAAEAAEETLWLLGPAGLRDFDRLDARPPAAESRAFADGGYYVMRDGWQRESNYLLLDCGPHGALNCGHAHADALSFVLASRGRALLVDPGTYTYTGAAALRDEFRASAAHNTLTLDGESSSVPDGPFSWQHIARPTARRWLSGARFDFFEGEHDGFTRRAPRATHARSVLFLKGRYWVVRDWVEAEGGARRADIHFHFAADAAPLLEEGAGAGAVCEPNETAPGLEIRTFGAGAGWRHREGWVSHCYGARRPAPVWTFSATTEGAREFITFLIPRAAGQSRARVREIGANGGRAFEVLADGRRDALLLGGGEPMTATRLASDFEWAWVRFAHDAESPDEVLLVGGRSLSLDGQELVSAAHRVGYLFARRDGDAWRVETDGGADLALALGGAARGASGGDGLEDEWRGAQPVAARG